MGLLSLFIHFLASKIKPQKSKNRVLKVQKWHFCKKRGPFFIRNRASGKHRKWAFWRGLTFVSVLKVATQGGQGSH